MDKANLIITIIIVLCIATAVAAYGIINNQDAVFSDLASMDSGSGSSGSGGIGNNTTHTGTSTGSGSGSSSGGSGSSSGTGSGSGTGGGSGSGSGSGSGGGSGGGSGSGTVHSSSQIRTLAMDLWASLEHKLCYKSRYCTSEIEERLTEISDELNVIDLEMNELLIKEQEIRRKVKGDLKDD